MTNNKKPFQINCLDHVAIVVTDLDKSIEWYENTLGLSKKAFEKWNRRPVFMLCGQSGVALFELTSQSGTKETQDIRIDHFAFSVDQLSFQKARSYFDENGIPYRYKDHYYFRSVYLHDPDGHEVELTTFVKN